MKTAGQCVFLLLTVVAGISAIGFDIMNWLNQFQFHVDPVIETLIQTQRISCRDCTRSTESGAEARFGFGKIVTQNPLPCCPTVDITNCKCGVEGASRIVGGTVTTAGKYPWIGAVNFNNNAGTNPGGCAATLIASEWAVTAAHCVSAGYTPSTLSLVFGEHDLTVNGDSNDGKRKNVKLVSNPIIHPNYGNPKDNSNDIALLKLETVDFGDFVPACLPAVDEDFTGKNGVAYGWGSTAACPSAVSFNALREVTIPILSDTDCEASSGNPVVGLTSGGCATTPLAYAGQISPEMMCAGTAGKDSCQGDSGGPFSVKEGDQHTLVGVVSWGYGCGADGLPGVYAEVAKLRTWIDETVGAAKYCPN